MVVGRDLTRMAMLQEIGGKGAPDRRTIEQTHVSHKARMTISHHHYRNVAHCGQSCCQHDNCISSAVHWCMQRQGCDAAQNAPPADLQDKSLRAKGTVGMHWRQTAGSNVSVSTALVFRIFCWLGFGKGGRCLVLVPQAPFRGKRAQGISWVKDKASQGRLVALLLLVGDERKRVFLLRFPAMRY